MSCYIYPKEKSHTKLHIYQYIGLSNNLHNINRSINIALDKLVWRSSAEKY